MKLIRFISIINVCIISASQIGYFCVPITDLLLRPIHAKYKSIDESIGASYDTISIAPQSGTYACARVHQGLFGEQVEILHELGQEVQVRIKNCFYESAFYMEGQDKYWTLKKWIVPANQLEQLEIPLSIFPEPIDYHHGYPDDDVLTLIMPWLDSTTKQAYSVGTRFVRYQDKDTEHAYAITLYDLENRQQVFSFVPKQLAMIHRLVTEQEQRQAFVDLLYHWTSFEVIPYVWGGVSFTDRCTEHFVLMQDENHGESILYWDRPEIERKPYAGFDCSGIILRAAQIVGIHYFYKNTTTITHRLHPLTPKDILQTGDILWTAGHVSIVGDIEKCEIIEAVGYQSGYGCLHAIALNKRYKGVATWDDLLDIYFHKKPLKGITRNGEDGMQSKVCKIFKLINNEEVNV